MKLKKKNVLLENQCWIPIANVKSFGKNWYLSRASHGLATSYYYYYCLPLFFEKLGILPSQNTCRELTITQVILILVTNPCDAQESYHFFPNDMTLAIGIQHRFSSSTFLFFNFIYFMSSTKYSMHSLYLKNIEV